MKAIAITTTLAAVCCMMLGTSCANKQETKSSELITVGNPYLPLWEHITPICPSGSISPTANPTCLRILTSPARSVCISMVRTMT